MHIYFRIGKPLLIAATSSVLALGFNTSVLAEEAAAPGLLLGPWSASAPQQRILLAQATAPKSNEFKLTGTGAASSTGSGKKPRLESTGEVAEAPWYGANNMHKYLGLAAVGAAALTMLAPKEEDGAHEMFANATAAFAAGAVGTGLYAHWDDLDFAWSDPDTKHAILGLIGTLGIALAVAEGGEGGHAGAGALGAIGMVMAVKYTW